MTHKDDNESELTQVGPREPGGGTGGPQQGRWYWVKWRNGPGLACATHVGSNYVLLTSPRDGETRVHFSEFWALCEEERDPDGVIEGKIEAHRAETQRLMGEIRELTARLAVDPERTLAAPENTAALVRASGGQPVAEYKLALVKAQKETLPKLFEQIKDSNQAMGEWMKAKLLPLEAQAKDMRGAIELIQDRVFHVELYAGLVETVELVRDGEPAPASERCRLMQRRAYMDEECLARYEAGGMEFKHLGDFDRWLARDANMKRLLPFPRTILAFQVRRKEKDREIFSIADLLHVLESREYDKLTFLYIRNGDRLYRLSTELDFGAQLFPDLGAQESMTGKLYARKFVRIETGSSAELITEHDFEARLAEYREAQVKLEAEQAEVEVAQAAWDAQYAEGGPDAGLRNKPSRPWVSSYIGEDPEDRWEPFTPESVYFDDIAKVQADRLKEHNRLMLVLQGLLDRSPVLHPHPTVALWTEDGFDRTFELVYDDARALTPGAKPNFAAYQAKLNTSLAVGSITVGQDDAWARHKADKENDRRDRNWRSRSGDYRPTHVRPHGNPGPGVLARVVKWAPKAQQATFTWMRERQRQTWRSDAEEIPTSFTCGAGVLLNVSAYTPGDFRQFFDDPRTRAEYLMWAPLLLEAEEFHAGNRPLSNKRTKK